MAERASQDTVIEASADAIMGIITDFEAYPEWVDDMKDAEVRETDDQGRATRVWYHVDARVMEIEYVLAYEYPAEHRLTWTLDEGEQITKLDGEYLLEEEADGSTRVRYTLEADLAIPMPGFMKKRAQKRIMETGLGELKRRAEALSS
jgi:ribosome-associated toxin RatA of RatAB toxin-antitoxin module